MDRSIDKCRKWCYLCKKEIAMPTISEFFGIKIILRFIDHNPPHFHATYQNDKVSIEIENELNH